MRLADVQAHVAARLAAVPALAALCPPVQYDPLAEVDPENPSDESKTLDDFITRQLALTGVVLLVDPPFAASGRTSRAGATLLDLVVLVKVAELPARAHTPTGAALLAAVIAAATAPVAATPGEDQCSCAGFDSGLDENGYILHVLDFRITGVEP